jgi:hypothetical protein
MTTNHIENQVSRPNVQLAQRSGTSGALAVGALAAGAFAVGALAVGALAIGRLAVGALALRRGHVRDLTIDTLRVGRLEVFDLVAPR